MHSDKLYVVAASKITPTGLQRKNTALPSTDSEAAARFTPIVRNVYRRKSDESEPPELFATICLQGMIAEVSGQRKRLFPFLVSAQSIVFLFPPLPTSAMVSRRSEREEMEEGLWRA